MTAVAVALSAVLLAAPAWLERLWKKPEPHLAAAFEKLRKGDAPAALELMDKAAASFEDPRDQAALAFDKSAAALMIGKQGAPIAADEAKRALEGSCGPLCAPSAYNLGFAHADQGKREEAIEAYGKSLGLDAGDQDAKYNLELLLREKEEQKKQSGGAGDKKEDKPQQGQDKDQQQQSQGDQRQKQQQKPEDKDQQQKKDQQQSQGQPEQKKPEQKDQGGQKQSQGNDQKDQQKHEPKDQQQQQQARRVDRTEAQRLLDALRASEKNLQVWRFGQRREKPARPRDAAKDW